MNVLKILKILIELFFKNKEIKVIPKNMPSITIDELRTILVAYTPNLWLSDETFGLVDTQNLKNFLIFDLINDRTYITEKLDCDDFSYMLMGRVTEWNSDNTFGIVWGLNRNGDAHAWNFFVNGSLEVKFVEPQNDEIFDPTTEKIWIMVV